MVKQHYLRFARYNQWANRRLYGAAHALPEDKLWRDLGAFFGSLMGTLNHVLVADMIWMARFTGQNPPPVRLNSVLHRDLPGLTHAREAMDGQFLAFVESLDEEKIAADVTYANTKGEHFTQPLDLLLTHLFNHQTHHRGQAHGLLTQLGGEPPVLDLIYFARQS
ncbi:DinB family protein [Telmatospirillum sp.]|uniref:DinB family protein n=1 Tax=Telmatospirillum sp. TaxID=2079197 RepID=UPI002851A627|nr:DinB family protein [Telmatospirillum sp.]MDR3435758.1 DinB family protein [Telmatospirillum sp.]